MISSSKSISCSIFYQISDFCLYFRFGSKQVLTILSENVVCLHTHTHESLNWQNYHIYVGGNSVPFIQFLAYFHCPCFNQNFWQLGDPEFVCDCRHFPTCVYLSVHRHSVTETSCISVMQHTQNQFILRPYVFVRFISNENIQFLRQSSF